MTELTARAAHDTLRTVLMAGRLMQHEYHTISTYIEDLERQVEQAHRTIKRAREGDEKFWLEVRTDPDSKRYRIEGSGGRSMEEIRSQADTYAKENPLHELWLIAPGKGEFPYGSPVVNDMVEREIKRAANGDEPEKDNSVPDKRVK